MVLVFLLVSIIGLQSCKTVAPVVGSHSRDSVHFSYLYRHDTAYVDRWHYITERGDTIYIRDSIYVYNGERVEIHDTVSTAIHDTVPVLVEKELSGMEQAAMNTGYATWALVALLIIIGLVTLIVKIR